jgi:hypothetical protein
MTINESKIHKRNERLRAHRSRLSTFQSAIERHAIRFRAHLNVSEYCYLPLELALTRLPNAEVIGLKHVPGMTLDILSRARTTQYRSFGALARREGDKIQIVFNDAYDPRVICVNVMEEVFHVLLGHQPDILRIVPIAGRHRTYDISKEDEAYGCAIATLVPFAGLYAMLTQRLPVARIAEHFFVPINVIQERIAATDLGHLANQQFLQLALALDGYR